MRSKKFSKNEQMFKTLISKINNQECIVDFNRRKNRLRNFLHQGKISGMINLYRS